MVLHLALLGVRDSPADLGQHPDGRALVDRVAPRWLTAGSMAALAGAPAWVTVVDPGWSAFGFGLVPGGSGGAIRTLEAGALPRYFGTTHLGSIRGPVAAVSVGSTAFGPLAFALVHDSTGGYAAALLGSAVLPLAVALAALVVPVPRPRDGAVLLPAAPPVADPPPGRDGGLTGQP